DRLRGPCWQLDAGDPQHDRLPEYPGVAAGRLARSPSRRVDDPGSSSGVTPPAAVFSDTPIPGARGRPPPPACGSGVGRSRPATSRASAATPAPPAAPRVAGPTPRPTARPVRCVPPARSATTAQPPGTPAGG